MVLTSYFIVHVASFIVDGVSDPDPTVHFDAEVQSRYRYLLSHNCLPTNPLTARRVCTPAFGAGGGHTHWVERGVTILEDARHSIVLLQYNISTYLTIEARGRI